MKAAIVAVMLLLSRGVEAQIFSTLQLNRSVSASTSSSNVTASSTGTEDLQVASSDGNADSFATQHVQVGDTFLSAAGAASWSRTGPSIEGGANSALTAIFILSDPTAYTLSGQLSWNFDMLLDAPTITMSGPTGTVLSGPPVPLGFGPYSFSVGGTLDPGQYTLTVNAPTGGFRFENTAFNLLLTLPEPATRALTFAGCLICFVIRRQRLAR